MVSPYTELLQQCQTYGQASKVFITDYYPQMLDCSKAPFGTIELYFDMEDAQEIASETETLINALKLACVRKVVLYMKTPESASTRALEAVLGASGIRAINHHHTDDIQADLKTLFDRYYKPDSIASYLKQGVLIDSRTLKSQSNRLTGFRGLDAQIGSLYSGLYVLGATSSLGKTTFCLQLADQLAERGNEVLFFSLEQSRLELVSKSLARRYKLKYPDSKISALEIRRTLDNTDDKLAPVLLDYSDKIADHISIIEGDFNCDVDYITTYTEDFINDTQTRPIVFVDYLQVLQPSRECAKRRITDTQRIIDYNVTELKRLSRKFNIPVVVVSSFNRSNYQNQVDFESFKGSGGIEYTADVVLALQLQVVNTFDDKTGIVERRKAITEAKNAEPREIELACKKNRYGRANFSVSFEYYPSCDYFRCKQ